MAAKEERNKLSLALKMNQAQKLCMELVAEPALLKEEQIQKIESISSSLLALELRHDLKGLAAALKSPQQITSLEKIQFCSGWEDLFLSGTEVAGSCQRIDGDQNQNKCLLAYCLDGKNAMVAVKAEDGKILARSILRLLWDKTEAKPVLFLDRLYPYPCPKERVAAIQSASIRCAQELGLELFIQGTEGDPVIESLEGSCPYEYADGASGIMRGGIFTIRGTKRIA